MSESHNINLKSQAGRKKKLLAPPPGTQRMKNSYNVHPSLSVDLKEVLEDTLLGTKRLV